MIFLYDNGRISSTGNLVILEEIFPVNFLVN
jgi:hypothetical protein